MERLLEVYAHWDGQNQLVFAVAALLLTALMTVLAGFWLYAVLLGGGKLAVALFRGWPPPVASPPPPPALPLPADHHISGTPHAPGDLVAVAGPGRAALPIAAADRAAATCHNDYNPTRQCVAKGPHCRNLGECDLAVAAAQRAGVFLPVASNEPPPPRK